MSATRYGIASGARIIRPFEIKRPEPIKQEKVIPVEALHHHHCQRCGILMDCGEFVCDQQECERCMEGQPW